MFHLLLARGFFDLHAAGLVGDNVGHLLVGESGGGKSTTALSLVNQGWHYLSDDALLLRQSPQGVEALGFRRQFYVDPSIGRHWPGCAKLFEQLLVPTHRKQFVDLEGVYPGRLRRSTIPQVLIFLRIVPNAESALTSLDQTSALVRLLGQSASLSFNRHYAREHLAVLQQLIGQTVHYELLAGQDLLDDPKKIDRLLSGIELPTTRAALDKRQTVGIAAL